METQFDIRLNNHRTDAKFTLIEQLHNINNLIKYKAYTDKELTTWWLKKEKDFSLLKLKTPHPNGLHAEINFLNI